MAADGARRGRTVEIRPRGVLFERALGIFTDVRAGEAPTALFLMVNVFLLFTAYYLIKPVREGVPVMGIILCATGGGEASIRTQDAAIDKARETGDELVFLYMRVSHNL